METKTGWQPMLSQNVHSSEQTLHLSASLYPHLSFSLSVSLLLASSLFFTVLSVWGGLNYFFLFSFFCLIWHVIERYGWELCTVRRWASNSQYWWSYGTLNFLKEGPNGQKPAKIGPLHPSFRYFCPRPLVRSCSIFFREGIGSKTDLLKNFDVLGLSEAWEIKSPVWYRPFPHTNLAQCTLWKPFDRVFKILGGEWPPSAIQIGYFYDADNLLGHF